MTDLEKFDYICEINSEDFSNTLTEYVFQMWHFVRDHRDLFRRALIEADETPVSEDAMNNDNLGIISSRVLERRDIPGIITVYGGCFEWRCTIEIKTIGQLRTLERLAGVKHVD